MFNNIGSKIKSLATVICWIGIIGSVIGGVALMCNDDEELIVIGIITALFGSLFSWIGCFFLYGFGQLVENSDIMVSKLGGVQRSMDVSAQVQLAAAGGKEDNNQQNGKGKFCPFCGKQIFFSEQCLAQEEGVNCPHCGRVIYAQVMKTASAKPKMANDIKVKADLEHLLRSKVKEYVESEIKQRFPNAKDIYVTVFAKGEAENVYGIGGNIVYMEEDGKKTKPRNLCYTVDVIGLEENDLAFVNFLLSRGEPEIVNKGKLVQ